MKKLAFLTTIILTANLLFSQINHIDTSFYSEALQETKMVDIYFPPGYDENPDTYYSVIYYLHGWFGDQNEMNGMIGMMESLINNGTIEPVIMVGADNSPGPFEGSMYMNSIIWGNYEDYMINDLTNWVESSFRAYPSRDHRAVLGFSMGGYGTFRFGIMHKDKFRVLAAAASQILNLTEVVLDSTRLHVLQQNQPGPPFFYDYDNSGSGSTTQFMFLVFGAFAPNLNTPQTYINPPIVEFPLDENGDYIDTILMKARNNSIDHLIHQLYPGDSVGIFFGCGSADASIYPCHIAFKDSLELLGLPYEFYDHNGGHMIPGGFKERALIFMDSLLSPPGIPPSTCLPEGITFTTQEEIDNFQINHPNCMEIEGDVTIQGNDITNLNGLSVLTSIGGDLEIYENNELTSLIGLENLASLGGSLSIGGFLLGNTALTSLNSLENLDFINGNLTIYNNYALTSLAGLENIVSIGGSLSIVGTNVMASLAGLADLSSIGGNLLINHNNALTSLAELENLASIGGDLDILWNDALTSMSGLENLTSIGGDLTIGGSYGNPLLLSLAGLENLASVEGSLSILNNYALISLEGLENLAYISDDLFIWCNSTLNSLSGLENLTSIGGDLYIEGDISLTSLSGLENVASIGGDIYIDCNYALTSLAGLENLTAIGGDLYIGYNFGNSILTSLSGLDNLVSVAGDLLIQSNTALISLSGLENLDSIGGHLFILDNAALTSLTGLENLASIGGDLFILDNDALTSLTGLENLASIGGDLMISDNAVLTSLTGLENLAAESITNLKIRENGLLSTCHVQSICNYLASPNGTVLIYDNAPGCNSPEEVLDICIEGVEKEESLSGFDFNFYPSPVTSCATLNFDSDEPGPACVDIYNSTGILVRTRKFTITSIGQSNLVMDFRSLPVGMYLCKVQVGDRVIAKKIIKQ